MPPYLFPLSAIVIGFAILFGVVELWSLVNSAITAHRMILFAKKNGWEYRPGIGSFFAVKPFELIAPTGIGLTITVRLNPNRIISWRSSRYSTLRLLMQVNNPRKVSLWIRNLHYFEKRSSYFNNKWDKQLVIQSKPTSFGRKVFRSPALLGQSAWLLKEYSPIRNNHVKLGRSGQLEILLINKSFSPQSVDALIKLTQSISDCAGTFES
jgi:hypothetical protein